MSKNVSNCFQSDVLESFDAFRNFTNIAKGCNSVQTVKREKVGKNRIIAQISDIDPFSHICIGKRFHGVISVKFAGKAKKIFWKKFSESTLIQNDFSESKKVIRIPFRVICGHGTSKTHLYI